MFHVKHCQRLTVSHILELCTQLTELSEYSVNTALSAVRSEHKQVFGHGIRCARGGRTAI